MYKFGTDVGPEPQHHIKPTDRSRVVPSAACVSTRDLLTSVLTSVPYSLASLGGKLSRAGGEALAHAREAQIHTGRLQPGPRPTG